MDTRNGNCPNIPRMEVIATVKTLPTITSTSTAAVCDSGTAIKSNSFSWNDKLVGLRLEAFH
jgi:hypothetical protein